MNNIFKDYSDYILETRYYIVRYFGLGKTYEERISAEKFIEILDFVSENEDAPYFAKCRYFVKYPGIDFVEVNREVYRELYKWQHNKKLHEIYEWRKHRDKYSNIDMESIPCNIHMEEEVIEQVCEEKLVKLLKKILSPNQYKIIYSIVFENKKQSQIAKENNISRQAVGNTVDCIRKKLKKFFN